MRDHDTFIDLYNVKFTFICNFRVVKRRSKIRSTNGCLNVTWEWNKCCSGLRSVLLNDVVLSLDNKNEVQDLESYTGRL